LLSWAAAAHTPIIRVATTTSTENSGLLGVLLPAFTKATGIHVRVIAVGSGKALKLAENGDVDAVLTHAPQAEDAFMAKGFGVDRREVMHNECVIIGPVSDPAGAAEARTAAEAFRRIAAAARPFISRGDRSGTHVKEMELWNAAGISPSGSSWYREAGQGMEAVLMMADEKHAYTLTDRATFSAVEEKIRLRILCEGDTVLFNPYSIIAVNPRRHPHVRYADVQQFIEWLTSKEAQELIAGFRIRGRQVFFPAALPVAQKRGMHD